MIDLYVIGKTHENGRFLVKSDGYARGWVDSLKGATLFTLEDALNIVDTFPRWEKPEVFILEYYLGDKVEHNRRTL